MRTEIRARAFPHLGSRLNSDEFGLLDEFRSPEEQAEWEEESTVHPHHERFRRKFAELVQGGTDVPRRVLELGGGPGWLAEHMLSEMEVGEYVLFDSSPTMLARAQRKLRCFESVRFLGASLMDQKWIEQVSGPFDAVVAMQSLHELRHKRHHRVLFERICSLLLPGGMFIVADGSPIEGSPGSQRLYATCEETFSWLDAAGFADVTLELTDVYERLNGKSSEMYLLSARRK